MAGFLLRRCSRPSGRAHRKCTIRRTNEPSRLLRLSRSRRHDDGNWNSNRNKMPGLQSSLSAVDLPAPYRRSPPKGHEARGRRALPIRIRGGPPAESFPARRGAPRSEDRGDGSVVSQASAASSAIPFHRRGPGAALPFHRHPPGARPLDPPVPLLGLVFRRNPIERLVTAHGEAVGREAHPGRGAFGRFRGPAGLEGRGLAEKSCPDCRS